MRARAYWDSKWVDLQRFWTLISLYVESMGGSNFRVNFLLLPKTENTIK